YKKILILIIFPYIYLTMVLVLPTQNATTTPGGLTNVTTVIEIDGYVMPDNFHTVFVLTYSPLTPFQTWILSLDKQVNVYEMTARQKDTSWRDDMMQGQVSKFVSYKTAIIKAFELASLEDPSIEIDYQYEGLYVYYRPGHITGLDIGNQIVEINGNKAEDYTHEAFKMFAYQFPVTFTIKKETTEGPVFELFHYDHVEGDEYMIFYPNYAINSSTPSFDLPGLTSNLGGASGGLIQTLALYASLLKLNIGTLQIAGTGTIEMDGTVDRIGGIQQKLYSVMNTKIDIFFVPESHASDIDDLETTHEIVFVNTIEEAVQKLHEAIND
ncbi:MAG: hypothetical protein IH571_04605, partial [Acholeplasmataceae bacterium]|nr:hypothetical protein [Acholeplasmataceae bacterium]